MGIKVLRFGLASGFLGAVALVLAFNVPEIFSNPDLGTDFALQRRADLVEQIEQVSPPTKEELISLNLGDGMRFVFFVREATPEEVTIVFPVGDVYPVPRDFFANATASHFRPTLYPRVYQQERYEFDLLPYDHAGLTALADRYQVASREYLHRSRRYVFIAVVSPETTHYRVFIASTPVEGQPYYQEEYVAVLLPEELSP